VSVYRSYIFNLTQNKPKEGILKEEDLTAFWEHW